MANGHSSARIDVERLFRPIGGWVERPQDLQPALDGQISADVIVVGGGFAGLSTALELRARGADVVILESEFAGFGASGRNAGYLAGGQGVDFDLFLKRIGRERAGQFVRYYEDGVSYVERKLEEYDIDCDYVRSGLVRAVIHPSQEKKMIASMTHGVELGAPAQYLDEAAMRARGIPPAFLTGYHTPTGGTLNPGKYVAGLRRAALAAGVRIYETSPVRSFTGSATIECTTHRGAAQAPHLVLATNAYTPQLHLLGNKIAAIRVSAIETQPLSPAQLASLGWSNREGITTQHNVMESHRLTAHNTIVTTTKRLGYVYGDGTPNVPDAKAYRGLATVLHDRFPTLSDLAIRSCWSGYISMANDALPVVGTTGDHQNILYAAGCTGHGVGTQSFVGELLADKIQGIDHPYYKALQHDTPSTLPEPFKWTLLRSMLGAAHMMDDGLNRTVRRQ